MNPEKTTSANPKDVPDWIRYLYCDLSGIIRGKAAYKYVNTKKLLDGVAVSRGILALNFADNMQAHDEFGAVGDLFLRPDNDRYIMVGQPVNTGVFLCDIVEEDGSEYDLCPRTLLKRQIERARQLGLYIEAAFEPEFYLYRKDKYDQLQPIDRSRAFSTEGMNEAAEFIESFAKALTVAGMTVEQYNGEHGHGQHEMSIHHAESLRAADNHVLYRELLRGQAKVHGLIASLSPKPSMSAAGSGCHVHLSVWDSKTRTNVMSENGEISAIGKSFIAGVLNHIHAIVAFGCSSVNSYDRIQPQSASSAYACWGLRNREAAIRIPPPVLRKTSASTNMELRFVDNSANPYLILASVIAAGLEGIENKHEPPPPLDIDPSRVSHETLEELRIYPIPTSLMDAAHALEHDAFMRNALGDKFLNHYCVLKQSEHYHYSSMSFEERVEHHLTAF
ncbi:MAG: glutamine synthetase family protein [Candidatus Obscuribacterales bacterium]|nr:glutamine synthetase family protein [Candidatus Obscuribacterales bacterium]